MRKQAAIKGKTTGGRGQTWETCGRQSADMARFANGWQKGEIFLLMYIAMNTSV